MSAKFVVSTKNGKVCGIRERSNFSDVKFYSFYGIPYGQPPVGDLRFRDPVKAKPWKSTRDCTTPRTGCSQFSPRNYEFTGTEDCLYLNVYTPQLPNNEGTLMPVVVCIHPGGFFSGSPDPAQFGSPDFVMHCGIVYVTVCYRLHMLGFLNLNLPDCLGNQGLKDVVMAFEWVRENVHFFNGDSKNITAFGASSGAEMVHALMLSPTVNGLFHKAIFSCSYLFNTLAIKPYNDSIRSAFDFGRTLGFVGDNREKLLEFFKRMPVEVFLYQMKFYLKKSDYSTSAIAFPTGIFVPSVDTGENAILPEYPRKYISSTERIPLLIGICENETVMAFTCVNRSATEKYFRTAIRQNSWGWAHDLSNEEMEFINKQIDSFYLKDYTEKNIPLKVQINILDDAAYSDLYDSLIDVLSVNGHSPVYVYKFEYVGEIAEMKPRLEILMSQRIRGTFHWDDFSYWSRMNEPVTQETKQVVRTFTKLLSNFAKTGNPNSEDIEEEWKPTTPENPCHLRISNELKLVDGKLNGERLEFWSNMKKQFKR